MKIFGAKLATDHPDYAVTLNNFALLEAATDSPLEALRRMQEAVEIENRMLSQIFSISSDNQRLTYLQQKRGEFYGFLSLVTQYLPDAPDAIQHSSARGLPFTSVGLTGGELRSGTRCVA